MNLSYLFYPGSIFPNLLLIIMPLLILVAITFFQYKENLIVGLIAAIPFYLLFVGSFLLLLLPIDLIIVQNAKSKKLNEA